MWKRTVGWMMILITGILLGQRFPLQRAVPDEMRTYPYVVLYHVPNGFRHRLYGVENLKTEYDSKVLAIPLFETRSIIDGLESLDLVDAPNGALDYDSMDAYVYLEVVGHSGDVVFWLAIDRFKPEYMLVNGHVVNSHRQLIRLIELLLPKGEADRFMWAYQ